MPQSFAEHLKSFPLSPNLGQSLERAHGFARDQSHKLVTLEHLLLALAEDPEAVIIMQAANVDLPRLTTNVSEHLGRLMEDMRADGAVEPRPDPELLRVLQAAATAALQSKRRQIDGAIVLAAVVGDGKSPAAGMLKALGMTFEEAIRALQRANTKARLKPQTMPAGAAPAPAAPVSQPSAPSPAVMPATGPAPIPTHINGAQGNGAQKPEVLPLGPQISTAQTAEEILAAARERIQKRAAAARAERAAQAPQPTPAAPEPTDTGQAAAELEAADESRTLAGAIEAAMTAPAPSAPEPAPTTTPAPRFPQGFPQARSAQAPAAEPQPAAPVSRLPPTRRPQGPAMPRPIQATEGPPRPPLPQRAGPQQQPQQQQRPLPGFPPPRAQQRQEPSFEPNRGPHLPMPNGSAAGSHGGNHGGSPGGSFGSNVGSSHPPMGSHAPASAWPTPAPAALRSGHAERGPLVENVPRVMRVGIPTPVEVHIARDKIESLIVALNSRDPRGPLLRPDAFLARALSVRLRSPQGGFWIEADAPETQWAENASTSSTSGDGQDEHAVWRWTVVPHRPGRGRLLLTVSTRTIGPDGAATELGPPDRAIEIKVKSNKLRLLGSFLGWVLVLSAGAAIGYFGQDGLEDALTAIRQLITG